MATRPSQIDNRNFLAPVGDLSLILNEVPVLLTSAIVQTFQI